METSVSHDDALLQRPLTEADRRMIRLNYGCVSDAPPPVARMILVAPKHLLRGELTVCRVQSRSMNLIDQAPDAAEKQNE